MFKCKVCAEKDARIQDLKEQIKSIQALMSAPPATMSVPYSVDAMLSGLDISSDKVNEETNAPEEAERRDAIRKEQIQLLTGTF